MCSNLTIVEKQKIVEQLKSETIENVSESSGLSRRIIRHIKKVSLGMDPLNNLRSAVETNQNNNPSESKNKKLAWAQRKEIIAACDRGVTKANVAKRYNVPVKIVYAICAQKNQSFDLAKPKSSKPLDKMPKSTFDIDDFKRYYSNEDKAKSIPYFWEKFDPENYSIWFCEYKYSDELTKVKLILHLYAFNINTNKV